MRTQFHSIKLSRVPNGNNINQYHLLHLLFHIWSSSEWNKTERDRENWRRLIPSNAGKDKRRGKDNGKEKYGHMRESIRCLLKLDCVPDTRWWLCLVTMETRLCNYSRNVIQIVLRAMTNVISTSQCTFSFSLLLIFFYKILIFIFLWNSLQ